MKTPYQEKYKEESSKIYSNSEYKFKDKAGIFFWESVGRFAPILAMKYSMTGFQDRGLFYESLAWLSAAAINFSPMIFKGAPLHLYGGYAGMQIGELRANVRRGKKSIERTLETIAKENPLSNPLPKEEIKQAA